MARFQNDDPREIVMRRVQAMMPKTIGLLVVAGVVVIGFLFSLAIVPTGHVGVLTRFGKVTGQVLDEGVHVVWPWLAVHRMSVRTQQLKETANVRSNEGLNIGLDISLLFHLDAQRADDVYQKLGPDYIDRVVVPNLRTTTRDVTASYSADALYTEERAEVAVKIEEKLTAKLEERGIVVESVLLRDVQLPQVYAQAIEAKQKAEQEALRMEFINQRERMEADRKRIEAAGIRDFQRIVAQGISAQLLTWKGIEATEQLAASPNAKVIVIGSGKNGLPLILGGQ
ncbi:prohibitin family protein [Acidobacteriia bacterium AH_259_A11_L15]|nr:prohibitin family protein [Acidobacteriia bacterium AH_259_A11_L15]